jgi:hypothetical protein
MKRRGFGLGPGRAVGGIKKVPPALQQANQLMTVGDYQGAAVSFESLAQKAEARGGRHAPFFLMQAGRARILLREHAKGMTHLTHGLTMLAEAERYTQLYRAGTRLIQELSDRKLEKEAQEITDLIRSYTPFIAEMATQRLPALKPILPTRCPACGGPVRSDEVEWIDEVTAECSFCGGPVRAKQ